MVTLSSSMLVSLVNGTSRSNPDSTDWAFLLAHCPVEPCTRWAPSSQTGRWLTSHRDPSSGQSVMSWAKLLIEHTIHAGRVTNNIETNTYLPQSLIRYERRTDGQTLTGKTNQNTNNTNNNRFRSNQDRRSFLIVLLNEYIHSFCSCCYTASKNIEA